MTQTIQDYRTSLLNAIATRKSYETAKNSDNLSMQTTLDNVRKSVDHDTICNVLMLASHNVETINRAERSNNRYNVYAYEKVANVARYLSSVASLNHYTKAIVKTLAALATAEMQFTHKDAVAACSKACKHSESKREAIIKTSRYDKHVHASTAATQSSSSINALQSLNIIREFRDTANNVAYALNTENEITQKLLTSLEIAF